MEEKSEFLSVKETAVVFKCHPNTIRKAIKLKYLTAIRFGLGPKSHYRISRKSIEKIHESISTVGSYLYLPKTSPRGDSRISPYVLIDTNTSVVLENFKHKTLIDKVGVMLKE